MSDLRDSITDAILTRLENELEEARGGVENSRTELGNLQAEVNALTLDVDYDREEVELVKKKLDAVESMHGAHVAHLKQIDKVLMVVQGDVKEARTTINELWTHVDNRFTEVLKLQHETLAALRGK